MRPDELDQLLSDEEIIEPSAGFAEAVMTDINREAETLPGIGFPAKPVLAALCSAALSGAAALVVGFESSTPMAAHLGGIAAWVGGRTAEPGSADASLTAASLALAAIVMLVPLATYEVVMRSRLLIRGEYRHGRRSRQPSAAARPTPQGPGVREPRER